MGLILSLKRADEVATPSLPLAFTTTVLPVTGTPKMPAIKAPFCVPCFPMRILLDSPAIPKDVRADIDVVVASRQILTRQSPHCHVQTSARVLIQSLDANSGVGAAAAVAAKRVQTICRVEAPIRVTIEGKSASGGI